MPIPGLYQTGGTTHPGGSITGAPGRNAAIVLLQDLGTQPRGGGARCRTRACSQPIDHWGPRFIQAGVDFNDFERTTARVETLGGLARRVVRAARASTRRWRARPRRPAGA